MHDSVGGMARGGRGFSRGGVGPAAVRCASRVGPLDGLGVLEVGGGGGLLCEPMTRLGASVTGIDASAEA